MRITVEIIRNGHSATVSGEAGVPLSEFLASHGHPMDLPCGGKGLCRHCAITVAGSVSEPTARERDVFSDDELRTGMRLACQTVPTGNARVELDEVPELEQIQAAPDQDIPAVNPLYTRWGVAVDIGTTTLCAQLYGPDGLAYSVTRKNPQTAFGADVVSRIDCALKGQGKELFKAVQDSVTAMVSRLAEAGGITTGDIDAVVLTGNTTMLYLLAMRDSEALSHAPFEADCLFGQEVPLQELLPYSGLNGVACLPRCVSAFVGADITTAIVASGMCESRETALLVDIGTNGEIALWHKGRLMCCSTAAGPAFEGVGISRGVYGVRGAIDRVRVEDGKARCSTIGGAPAVGICGSGIVDALAAMLELEIIDETGAFQIDEDYFNLENNIAITAKDVRMAQLAKGAVRAGIETLLQTAGVAYEELASVYIAGGFGNYLRLESAAAIGLLPRETLSQVHVIGNAALSGAAILLQDISRIKRSFCLAENAETISLDSNPAFSDNYMRYMFF